MNVVLEISTKLPFLDTEAKIKHETMDDNNFKGNRNEKIIQVYFHFDTKNCLPKKYIPIYLYTLSKLELVLFSKVKKKVL